MLYSYTFKVVPQKLIKKYVKELESHHEPVDRYSALTFGALSLLLIQTGYDCLDNIAEEKRLLNIWVRERRSGVRWIRGKGSSARRASANRSISNAADHAKNQLDYLRSYAPQIIALGEKNVSIAKKYVSIQEIKDYIPTCLEEINLKNKIQTQKISVFTLYGLAIVGLFLSYFPLAILAFILAATLNIIFFPKWTALKKSEDVRTQQIQSVIDEKRSLENFQKELDGVFEENEDKDKIEAKKRFMQELKDKYQYLDIACRDLNSEALSWENLASEIIDETSGIKSIDSFSSRQTDKINTREEHQEEKISRTIEVSGEQLIIDAFKENIGYRFPLQLEQIRFVMRFLGYKRLPREWSKISLTAEDKITKKLSEIFDLEYERYMWIFEENIIKAEDLDK